MVREPSTPRRRFKDCRIMYRPWAVPTLIAYPPPPAAPVKEPVVVMRPSTPLEAPRPLPVRSRSERRRRDCIFIPDMDVALQFIEARRHFGEVERGRVDPLPLPRNGLDGPLAIGLLMTVAPPLAVTLVWSSPRFTRAAQIALTVYGALVTVILAAVVLSLI
jgi:hypothetical protein